MERKAMKIYCAEHCARYWKIKKFGIGPALMISCENVCPWAYVCRDERMYVLDS